MYLLVQIYVQFITFLMSLHILLLLNWRVFFVCEMIRFSTISVCLWQESILYEFCSQNLVLFSLKQECVIYYVIFFTARVGLMHIGVFILLLLSGERNFGVRLNKPYTVRVPMDIPVFTGTHADFLIIVSFSICTFLCGNNLTFLHLYKFSIHTLCFFLLRMNFVFILQDICTVACKNFC